MSYENLIGLAAKLKKNGADKEAMETLEKVALQMAYDHEKGMFVKAYDEGQKQVQETSKAAQDAMQIAGIKGRFIHLNIEWTPKLEQEARKRDGGGITVFLERIAAEQEEARQKAREANPGYGSWA